MLRMIREEEPPKPSTRLSNSGEALASISAQRQTEPAKLTKLVRGELDWIVMKCLEKDRNRRYETASGLAADVQRYLNDEPVQACPPSALLSASASSPRRNKAASAVSASAWRCRCAGRPGDSAFGAGVRALVSGNARKPRPPPRGQANRPSHREASLERATRGVFQRITLAHRELSADNLGRAREHLNECPEDLRSGNGDYLMRLCRVEPLIRERGRSSRRGVQPRW